MFACMYVWDHHYGCTAFSNTHLGSGLWGRNFSHSLEVPVGECLISQRGGGDLGSALEDTGKTFIGLAPGPFGPGQDSVHTFNKHLMIC